MTARLLAWALGFPALLTISKADVVVVKAETTFLGFFTKITFNNGPCVTSCGGPGTCYKPQDCTERGGVAAGPCAQGFGVCCSFIVTTCGADVVQNCTKLRGSVALSNSCVFNLGRCSADVCFNRLSFNDLVLPGIDSGGGQCTSKTISFSASTVPSLCGNLTGQHIYLPVTTGLPNDNFVLSFFGSGTSQPPSFPYEIFVEQIPCLKSFTPPAGCEQFFFGPLEGSIKTYNFGMFHLNDQNYDICIRKEQNVCSNIYTVIEKMFPGFAFGPFFMSNSLSLNEDLCPSDYILIPNSKNISPLGCMKNLLSVPTPSVSKYCGFFLNCNVFKTANAQIETEEAEFKITVVTDDDESSGIFAMMGFEIAYSQVLCTR